MLYMALRVSAADACAALHSAQERIDLSSLMGGGDYVVSEQTGDVYLSVCGGVKVEAYHVEDPAKVGAYRDGESLGEFTTELEALPNHEGAVLRYVNGGTCSSQTSIKQSTTLLFDCDRSRPVSERPVPVRVPTADACAHVFMFATQLACPGVSAASSGSFLGALFGFLGLLVLAVFGFVGLHVAYTHFVLRESAQSAVGPAFAKLGEAAVFVKDMAGIVALTIYDRIRGLMGGMRGGGGRSGGFRGLDDDGGLGPGRGLLEDEDDDFS